MLIKGLCPSCRVHREILVFASPFFEAALSGDWSETRPDAAAARRQSISSVITISQPPSNPADKSSRDNPTEMTFTPTDPDICPDDLDIEELTLDLDESSSETDTMSDVESKEENRKESLKILEGAEEGTAGGRSTLKKSKSRKSSVGADAVIVLKEEKASTFHDFLKFVYPQYASAFNLPLSDILTIACAVLNAR